MPIFLAVCLLIAVNLYLLALLRERGGTGNKQRNTAIITACVLMCALLLGGAATLGFMDDFLAAVVLILLLTVGWLAWKGICRNKHELSVPATVIFGVYLVALLWITLLSRDGSNNTKVLFSMDKLGRFLRTGEVGEFGHVLLNILMFIPLGFLLPMLCRGRLDRVLYVLAVGLWMTATIESIQYLLVIGQCDLEDVIGNTLGSIAGYGLQRLYRRIR